MKVVPIPSPLPGERVLATSPAMRPDTDARWRQRIHYWAGRSLTAEALELDQENRAARMAWLGRLMTPGIVSGLEVALEEPAPRPDPLSLEGHFVHVAPGVALTASGEDVVVPRALRVPLSSIPVEYVRVARTPEFPAGEERPPGAEVPPDDAPPRRLDLGTFAFEMDRFPAGHIPWAAALVLRPAELRAFGQLDPDDPCELDPSRDAFADERRIDAAQLVLCQFPVPWEALPDLANPGDATWRNRLAHVVFRAEAEDSPRQQLRLLRGQPGGDRWDTVLREGGLRPRELTAGASPSPLSLVRSSGVFPWELLGAPIALFSAEQVAGGAGQRFFLDRAAVARTGGRARSRSRPATRVATDESDVALNPPGAGVPGLWHARVVQFAEHLASLEESDPAEQGLRFQFFPPAGLLEKSALTLLTTAEAQTLGVGDRADTSNFFPETFRVEAAPIPLEDLDAAMAAGAALAPLDRNAEGETLRILIPLPLRVFDPNVLVVEAEDPFFLAETGRLAGVRQDWRQRKDFVVGRRDALEAVATGPRATAFARVLEPGQLEPEPTETLDAGGNLSGLGVTFGAAWLSPRPDSSVLEITPLGMSFSAAGAADALFVVARMDLDAPPTRIEAVWGSGDQEFRWQWRRGPAPTSGGEDPTRIPEPSAPVVPPPAPGDDPAETPGAPAAGFLWVRLQAPATELGIANRDVTSLRLRVEGGRIALGPAGILRGADTPNPGVEVWLELSTRSEAEFVGGEWTLIQGQQLLAPFEDPYSPVFEGGETLDERLTDLDTALRLSKGGTVREIGLTALAERLVSEINEADDAIDLGFLKAQSNAHRARQVIMGEEAANELLTSPVLNSVVQAKSAKVAQETLLTAYKAAPDAETRTDARSAGGAASRASNIIAGGIGNPQAAANPRIDLGPILGGGIINPVGEVGGIVLGPREIAETPGNLRLDIGGVSGGIISGGGRGALPSRDDILRSEPLVGQTPPIRTLSIAKRFNAGPALAAYDYAHAGFLDALALIRKLPLLYEPDNADGTPVDAIPDVFVGPADRPEEQRPVSFHRYHSEPKLVVNFRESVSENERAATFDQGTIIARAVRRADASVVVLRRLEFYVARHREELGRVRETLAALSAQIIAARNRLALLEGELSEARHDVSVARSLWQEERARVFEVNQSRDALIREQIKFLAYVRTRDFDQVLRRVPSWKLSHADEPQPLPACLRRHDDPDPALQAYVDLFRHAPARWFPKIKALLSKLDTRERLVELLDSARLSAARFAATSRQSAFSAKGDAALFTYVAQQQVIGQFRLKTAQHALIPAREKSWSDFRREAEEHVSVGDLIEGRHAQTKVGAVAAEELEQIAQVGTCLHAEFAAVNAGLRLAWVERFSQFDKPGLLRDLTALPQFGRLERGHRRRLQEFVDWLFGRVTSEEADAVNLINDFVRLCLLIASHAPVNQIIAGHVPRPTPVRPGILIPIRPLNPKLVRVGMAFQVWQAERVVARGVVQDLRDTEVSARVDEVETKVTTIETSMQVRFIPEALAVTSKAAKRILLP